ncbi:MAG: hypothetical protein ACE5L6_03165 [Candidatus Bathyarchaeia archaeon]
MTEWGFAFKKGFIIFLWSIVWGIVGGIIGAILSGGALFAVITNPAAITDPTAMAGAMMGIFAGVLIGSLIASIGVFASMVKIITEAAEELRK